MGADILFDIHGRQVAIEHRGWAHGDLPKRGHGELERKATRIEHAVADMLGNGAEMGVAGVELGPGVADPDYRASLELVLRKAAVLEEGPGRFDDLTGTALAGHHQPLRVWVLCLYFMGLNLSNRQIALELGLSPSDVQAMTEHLRRGLVAKVPAARLESEVEIDEVYVVAGHKGQPAAVAKRGGSGAVAGWPARRAGARWRRTSHPFSA